MAFARNALSITRVEPLTHVPGFTHTDHTYNLNLIDAEPENLDGPDADTAPDFSGQGIFVAVMDTGLIKEWRNCLREESVNTALSTSFVGAQATANPNKWQFDTNSHGLAVAATIVGYKLSDDSDEGGFLHQPVTGIATTQTFVRGVAPDATVVVVKVCEDAGFCFVSGSIAGFEYVASLVSAGGPLAGERIVINFSVGGPTPSIPEELAINQAIAASVIIVVSAGNSGNAGMSWPGAFPQVISAGAVGWNHPFGQPASNVAPTDPVNTWWSQDHGSTSNPPEGSAVATDVFVASFSGRDRQDVAAQFQCVGPGVIAFPGAENLVTCTQDLDVVAPGRRILLPFLCVGAARLGSCGVAQPPADPLPPQDDVPPRYLFISGTSFSAPTTTGIVALLLQKNPGLDQTQIENTLENTAQALPDTGTFFEISANFVTFIEHTWNQGAAQEAMGVGLAQADGALAALP